MVVNKFAVKAALVAVCHTYPRVTELISVVASPALTSVFGVWLEHFVWSPEILPGEKPNIVKGIVSDFSHMSATELTSTFKTPCPVR